MGLTDRYRGPKDLPEVLPVFPLLGAILLPRATLSLNVFEPRYLELVDFALAQRPAPRCRAARAGGWRRRVAARQELSLAACRLRGAHYRFQRGR